MWPDLGRTTSRAVWIFRFMKSAGSRHSLVGPVLSDVFKMTPDMGLRYTIVALVVVIIGGGRTMIGTVLGGLVVGLSETLGVLYLPGSYGGLMPYALLAAVLLMNPRATLSMVRGR